MDWKKYLEKLQMKNQPIEIEVQLPHVNKENYNRESEFAGSLKFESFRVHSS